MFRELLKIGAPERSRTPNPQIRSLVLYPVELRALSLPQGRGEGGNNYSPDETKARAAAARGGPSWRKRAAVPWHLVPVATVW